MELIGVNVQRVDYGTYTALRIALDSDCAEYCFIPGALAEFQLAVLFLVAGEQEQL